MCIRARPAQGVATTLWRCLEKLAAARGATKLTVDASDTAHPFFLSAAMSISSAVPSRAGGEWLARTLMQKALVESLEKVRRP